MPPTSFTWHVLGGLPSPSTPPFRFLFVFFVRNAYQSHSSSSVEWPVWGFACVDFSIHFASPVEGVKHEHSLHLVRYRPPTTPASTTASAGGAYASGTSASQPQQGMPQSPSASSASLSGSHSPFGFGGNGGAFGTSGGTGGMFGGLDMNAMLDNPAVQALLSDENLMSSMIENHPQLRQMMESNPELGHALRNPALMREAMNAMRNPAAMQEMQRNADRALLSIENHPEGWRMLQSMYHQLDEPLSDPLGTRSSSTSNNESATQEANNASSTAARPEPTTPNSNALPNPWASRGTSFNSHAEKKKKKERDTRWNHF